MIRNIPKPDISPAFTVDDIHKIREWHYERLKDATQEERDGPLQTCAGLRASKCSNPTHKRVEAP